LLSADSSAIAGAAEKSLHRIHEVTISAKVPPDVVANILMVDPCQVLCQGGESQICQSEYVSILIYLNECSCDLV
jgi:hypothetical protein